MDNASKALIMAGAILLSVAIVGIGIYIFSTASALTDDAVGQVDALGVTAMNARLERYFGDNVRGTVIQQLVRDVNAMNRQRVFPFNILIYNHDEAVTTVVTNRGGNGGDGTARTYELRSDFKSNLRYKIYADRWSDDGYIVQIHIDEASNVNGVCPEYGRGTDYYYFD